MASLKGTKTEKNILTAFAGESQARNRYTYYSSKARSEGYRQIANIFEETANHEKEHAKRLYKFLERLSDQARMPSLTEFHVLIGSFDKMLVTAPRADINIFGLGDKLQFDFMRKATEITKSSCLYVKDSGWESALV